jgi:methylglutaconyl-CoA hydratase
MTDNILDVKKDARGFVTVTMNRPDVHNAFDDVLIKKMTLTLQEIDKQDDVLAIIIRGSGKSFSAGADLNWMRRMADYSWEQNYQDSLALASLMSTLAGMRKTTIAAVQGAAFGGGVGLVACCDIAIASNKAKFCLSEVKLGLIPAVISPYVVEAIGKRNANRYFITAEIFNGIQAKDLGLVSEVVDIDGFDAHIENLLDGIAKNGPESIYAAKKLIELVANKKISEDLIRETASRIADQRASSEGKEGVSAFLEKRNPNWIKD